MPVTQLDIRHRVGGQFKGKPALVSLQITHWMNRVKAGHCCLATYKSNPFLEISHFMDATHCITSGGLPASSSLYNPVFTEMQNWPGNPNYFYTFQSIFTSLFVSRDLIRFLESSAQNSNFALLDLFQRLSPSLFLLQ